MIVSSVSIKPQSIHERRQMRNGMCEYDRENGVCASQRAKYEKSNGAFVVACLNGRDRKGMTCMEISKMLESHLIFIPSKAVYRILHHMIYRVESIHPCRRNIGQSVVAVVKAMGEIKYKALPEDADGVSVNIYWLGNNHRDVIQQKRAFELVIKP